MSKAISARNNRCGHALRSGMNTELSREDFDAYLRILRDALVLIRCACYQTDLARAEAISDAFHNLPDLLLGWPGYTADFFERIFLRGLVERYPELSARFDRSRLGDG